MVGMCDYPDDRAGKLTPIERSCVKLTLLAATGSLILLAIFAVIVRRFL